MLRELILEIGRVPDHRELPNFGLPVYRTFYRAFGSWNAAVEAAGFKPNENYGRIVEAKCGHIVRSSGECSVCNWFFAHGIEHEYEPSYGKDVRWRADWKVGDTLVEYWGLKHPQYLRTRLDKEQFARENGIRLVGLEPNDNLDKVLGAFLRVI